jgi:hypothetical protein
VIPAFPDPTPIGIVRQLTAYCDELATVLNELPGLAGGAARSETTYRRDHAKAFILAGGSVDARKSAADIDCEEQMLAAKVAAASFDAAKTRANGLRTLVSAGQSMLNVDRTLGGAA